MKGREVRRVPIGERGQTLSGGQRQCIALARALLPDPPVLVLDEPTSMMDIPAENAFKARMRRYMQGKTLVLITHRPSLLDLVDRIIVMGRGRIVADGPRDEILSKGKMRPQGAARREPAAAKPQAAEPDPALATTNDEGTVAPAQATPAQAAPAQARARE